MARRRTAETDLLRLRREIIAALDDIEFAIKLHEAWRPSVSDPDLRARIDRSYATHTFNTVQQALSREMVLAITRLWDKRNDAVGMVGIRRGLSDARLIDTLAAERVTNFGNSSKRSAIQSSDESATVLLTEFGKEIRQHLKNEASSAIAIIDKYLTGAAAPILASLQQLRHERLAHRSVLPKLATNVDQTEQDVTAFFVDMMRLTARLVSLVEGVAYDLEGAAKQYRRSASLFWMSVRGERTEGHPNYTPPDCGGCEI